MLVSLCHVFTHEQSWCVARSVFRVYRSDRDPFARVFVLQVASITQAHCVISGAAGCVNEIVSSATSPGSFLELCFVELGYSTRRADPLFTHIHALVLQRNSFLFSETLSKNNPDHYFINSLHILNQISLFLIILTPPKLKTQYFLLIKHSFPQHNILIFMDSLACSCTQQTLWCLQLSKLESMI